jgi:hypothetical protein
MLEAETLHTNFMEAAQLVIDNLHEDYKLTFYQRQNHYLKGIPLSYLLQNKSSIIQTITLKYLHYNRRN